MEIARDKSGNWVYLQEVSSNLGAWKWSQCRFYYRVVVTNMDPSVWGPRKVKYCGETPGVLFVWESRHCSGDYPGGRWGWKGPEDEA